MERSLTDEEINDLQVLNIIKILVQQDLGLWYFILKATNTRFPLVNAVESKRTSAEQIECCLKMSIKMLRVYNLAVFDLNFWWCIDVLRPFTATETDVLFNLCSEYTLHYEP